MKKKTSAKPELPATPNAESPAGLHLWKCKLDCTEIPATDYWGFINSRTNGLADQILLITTKRKCAIEAVTSAKSFGNRNGLKGCTVTHLEYQGTLDA